jgi:hypothetical protein
MHKSAVKCNKTVGKWCKNKHGASKIIDTLETYQVAGTYPMVIGLPAGSTDIRGNRSDSNAKFPIIPHRRSTVLVEYPTQ